MDEVIEQPSVDGAFDKPKVCYINIFDDIRTYFCHVFMENSVASFYLIDMVANLYIMPNFYQMFLSLSCTLISEILFPRLEYVFMQLYQV